MAKRTLSIDRAKVKTMLFAIQYGEEIYMGKRKLTAVELERFVKYYNAFQTFTADNRRGVESGFGFCKFFGNKCLDFPELMLMEPAFVWDRDGEKLYPNNSDPEYWCETVYEGPDKLRGIILCFAIEMLLNPQE